jgi:hypothetical protein
MVTDGFTVKVAGDGLFAWRAADGRTRRDGADSPGVSELASSPFNAAAQRTRLTSVSEEVA